MNQAEVKELWENEWLKPECCFGDSYIGLPFKQRCSILEVGCGDLKYSPFPESATKFIGIDISHEALRRTNPRYKCVNADVLALPFRANSFDMVVSIDVLSTLGLNIFKALEEMKRVSKDKLYFSVVHPDLKYKWKDTIVEEQEHFSLHIGRALDIATFNEDQIERVCKRLGLENVVVQAFNGNIHRVSRETTNDESTPPKFLKWMIYVLARKK